MNGYNLKDNGMSCRYVSFRIVSLRVVSDRVAMSQVGLKGSKFPIGSCSGSIIVTRLLLCCSYLPIDANISRTLRFNDFLSFNTSMLPVLTSINITTPQ